MGAARRVDTCRVEGRFAGGQLQPGRWLEGHLGAGVASVGAWFQCGCESVRECLHVEELDDDAFPHSLGVHSGPPERIEIEFEDSYRLEFENLGDAIRGEAELLLGRDDAIGQAATLQALHDELNAGVKSSSTYTVREAVDDWLREGLDGTSDRTRTLYEGLLGPLLSGRLRGRWGSKQPRRKDADKSGSGRPPARR